MKRKAIITAMLVAMAMNVAIAADFYRYIDRDGNVRFTDDLSQVPMNQRETTQRYEASQALPPQPAQAETAVPAPAAHNAGSDQDAETLDRERDQLEALGRELDAEYEALMQERSKLDEEQQELVARAAVLAHNEKIEAFNARIQAYDQKRKAYSDQIKTFNERVAAQQAD